MVFIPTLMPLQLKYKYVCAAWLTLMNYSSYMLMPTNLYI